MQTAMNFQEWKSSKGARLSGLSEKEKKLRYGDYKISVAMNGSDLKRKNRRQNFKKGVNTTKSGKSKKTMGSLSECTMLYAHALMDPWSIEQPPCIPDQVVLPSYKFGAQSRGVLQIGTAGTGFVACNPYYGVAGGSNFHLYYTDSTYASADYTSLGGTTGLYATYNDSSLLFSNWKPDGFQFRVVGCGIKTRYMGSEVARSGRIVEYRQPNNYSIQTGITPVTVNDLLLNRETQTAPADRTEHYVTFRPSGTNDLSYLNNDGFTPLPPTPTMAIIIQGGTPGQAWEYDIQWWFEVTGNLLPTLTRSESDPLGLAAVRAALPLHQPKQNPKSSFSTFLDDVGSAVMSSFSFISPLLESIGGIENVIPIATAMFS